VRNTIKRFLISIVLATLSASIISCGLLEDGWQPVRHNPPPVAGIDAFEPPVPKAGEPSQPSRPPAAAPKGPLKVTIEEAVLLALENNRALRVERLNPPIQRTFFEQELAVFEPVLTAEASGERERTEARTGGESAANTTGGGVGISEFLPTGTTIEAEVTTERTYGDAQADQHATRGGLSITQSLLEGRGIAVNLADLRQARLDTIFSRYELRGFAESLVADVETTYWKYVLSQRGVEIVEESLKLAEQQLEDTRHRVRVGSLAETELAAGEAELALRREALINARSLVATLQVRLLRLMYPQALPGFRRDLTAQTKPTPPPVPLESLGDHVAVALRMRPDLNQAELLLQRGELEIVKTRNGLLPRMDLFVTLGKTGYAHSFGRSVRDVPSDGYDFFVGLEFEQPIYNRDAKATHQRALLTRDQLAESLRNLQDLARQDVELAFIEVNRTRQQVDATASTRRLQEEKLRAETAKFQVGKSTSLLVAAAQRDLLASQVSEIEALANYLNARTNLYLLEGSLLERRGLSAPGREPVKPESASPATRPTTSPAATRPAAPGS